MNAIISGRAGVAMILDGDDVASLKVGSGEIPSVCTLEDYAFVFGDADDLQFLEDVEISEISRRLAQEFAKELALQLVLVLLDSKASPHTRRIAGQELKDLLRDDAVERFVEDVLYARALPVEADLTGALSCIPGDASRTSTFLKRLGKSQGYIGVVQRAWEAIPNRYFGEHKRSHVRAAAIRAGWFREVVIWNTRGGKGMLPLGDMDLPSTVRQELIAEWIGRLERPDARFAEMGEEAAFDEESTSSELSFVAEGPADLDEAINLAYEALRIVRARRAIEPASAAVETQRLKKLRMLQRLGAQEIAKKHQAASLLPRSAWEDLAQAQRMLSP